MERTAGKLKGRACVEKRRERDATGLGSESRQMVRETDPSGI